MNRPDWKLISGTPNYAWGEWRAIYIGTVRGQGSYRTFRPGGALYGIGGLPTMVR